MEAAYAGAGVVPQQVYKTHCHSIYYSIFSIEQMQPKVKANIICFYAFILYLQAGINPESGLFTSKTIFILNCYTL